MRSKFLLSEMWLCVCLGASALPGSEITSYVTPDGRRIYVNAEEPPKPAAKSKSSRSSPNSSVLVRRDPRTGELATIPPRHARETTTAVQAAAGALEKAATAAEEKADPAAAVEIRPPGEPEPAGEAAAGEPPRYVMRRDVDVMIENTAERHEMDPAVLRALIKVESNFNPSAISYKGAVGLMQLMPGTARRYGVRNSFDPEQNLDGGTRYLKDLLALYSGDLRLSLAAYNAGENAVKRYNGVPPYAETQQYVRKISGIYRGGWLISPRQRQPDSFGIVKYVDANGKVRFSNTEGF